jgi:hypothetical protein
MDDSCLHRKAIPTGASKLSAYKRISTSVLGISNALRGAGLRFILPGHCPRNQISWTRTIEVTETLDLAIVI